MSQRQSCGDYGGAAAVNFSAFRLSKEVANEYDDKHPTSRCHAVIRDLLKNGHKQILFNLADVASIDTIGFGSLVGAFTTVRKQGGDLKLLNLPEKFAGVMQITKLYTVFDTINDEAAAVKSFCQSTSKARA